MQTKETANAAYETQLNDWIVQEKAAIELIGTIGKLWFEKSVELILFRNQLVDRSVSEIMNLHLYAKNIVKKPITVNETLEISKAIYNANVCPSRVDIGKLAYEYHQEKANFKSVDEFIGNKLKDLIGAKSTVTPKDVVLYGFGRIGRLAARELISQAGKGEQLRLRAIVTRGSSNDDIIKRADLLRTDSVHGNFPGTVIEDLENKALIINGHTVHMIDAKNPEDVDYTAYGINDALLIDNTGVFRDDKELSRHLGAKGISKVLLTAPAKGDVPNVVHGVNHETVDVKNTKIFSAASCTTNAITPVLKAVEDTLGVVKGHLETIHAYTNDQNLVDNMHKKYRRGRAAALNMVITETGAGSAVAKALPALAGKLTSNAIRVPVPNGSLVVLNLEVGKNTSVEEVNNIMKKYALEGDLVEQIKYSLNNELVSSDIVGTSAPAIFDSNATIVSGDGKNIVMYVWYDNEYGYSHQVIRLAKYIAKVRRYSYY